MRLISQDNKKIDSVHSNSLATDSGHVDCWSSWFAHFIISICLSCPRKPVVLWECSWLGCFVQSTLTNSALKPGTMEVWYKASQCALCLTWRLVQGLSMHPVSYLEAGTRPLNVPCVSPGGLSALFCGCHCTTYL